MTNIATTKEQSTRLLQCGVDPETADMVWTIWDNDGERYEQLSIMDESAYEMACLNPIPAWSLGALLTKVLPKEIVIDGYRYRISIYFENPDEPVIGNQWCLFYAPLRHNERSHRIDDVPMYAPDSIEACVRMVEKLKEEGRI